MKFPGKRNNQRGQALVEYGVIAALVIVAFAAVATGLSGLLASNVQSTMTGFSSPAQLKSASK